MSANAPQPDTDELKRMISKFRVHELQCLLIYAGKSKNGKKQELYDRVMVLFENNPVLPAPLRIKIQDLYAKFMATQPCWVRMPSTSPDNSHSSVNEQNYMQSSSLNKSNYPSYQPCGSRPSQNYTVAFAPSYGNHTSYRSLINASNTNRTNLRILTQQQNNNSINTANTQNSRQNRFADFHHQQQNSNPGAVHYPHQNGPSMHASSAVNRSSSQHHSNINSQTRVVFERGNNANNRPILINNNNTQSSVLYNSNNNNIVVSNVPLNSQNPNNQNGAGMQQTKMPPAVFNPKSYVVQPTGVNLKPLPFYEPICDLIKPTTLIPYNVEKGGPQETFFMFHLTPKMVEEILTSRFKCPLTGKEDYGTQIQLRFCIYNEEIINCPQNQNQIPNVNHKSGNSKIKKSLPVENNNIKKDNNNFTINNGNIPLEDEYYLDNLPTNICIKVNGFPAPLPLALPPKPPSTEPRRPGRPINLTSLVKLSPMIENHLNISWTLSYSQSTNSNVENGKSSTATQNLVVHIMALYLVKKFTTQALLNRLLIKPHIKQNVTKNLVKQKLKCVSDDVDDEIATTCVGVSLLCPLSKSRINYPSRAHSCDHFQCFDAVSYLSMNEKNAKWTCPICYKSAPYETLAIDTFFLNILTTCPSTVREIELNADSSWKAISENLSINSQSTTNANTLNKRKQPSHCNTTMGNNTQQCNKKLNNSNLDPSSTIEIIEDELLCSNEGQELLENSNEKNDKSNNVKNRNILVKNTDKNSLNYPAKYTTEGGTGDTSTLSQDEGHDSDIVILSSSSEDDETINHQPLAPAKNSYAHQEKNGKISEKNLQQPLIKSATLNENSQSNLNLAVNAKENDGETIINKASNMGLLNQELEHCVMRAFMDPTTPKTNQETQSLDTTTSQNLTENTTKSLESQQISSSESIQMTNATLSKSPLINTTEIDSLPVTSMLAEQIICNNTTNIENPLKEPSNMSILASNTTTVVHSRLKRLRQCLNALDDNNQNENDDTFEKEQRTNNLPTTEKNDDNIDTNMPASSEECTNNPTSALQSKQNNQVKKHRKATHQRIQSPPPSNLETQPKTNANHDATTLPKANNSKKHKPQNDSSDDSECEIINICSPLESQPNVIDSQPNISLPQTDISTSQNNITMGISKVTQSLSSLISSAMENSPIFSGPLSQTSSLLSYQIPKKIARKVDEKCSELLIAQLGKTKTQTNINISQDPLSLTNFPMSPMKSITSGINLSVSGIYGGAYTVSTLNSLDINSNNNDKSILTTNKENSLVEPMDYINNSDNLKTHANISPQKTGKQLLPISNANIDNNNTTSTFFSGYSNESSNHDTLFEKMAQINAKKVQELLKTNPFLTIPSGTLPSSILQKSVSNSTQQETNNLTPLKNNSSPTKNIFSSNFTTNLSLTNVTSHDAVSNIFQSNYNNFTSNVDNITPQLPLTSLSTNIFKDMAESTNQQQLESLVCTKSPDKNPKVNLQNVGRQNVFDALLTSNTNYSSVSANSLFENLSNLSNSLLPSINNQAQNSLNHNNSTSGLLKSSTLKSLFPPSSSSMMSRNNDYGTCLDLATITALNQPLVDSQAPSSFNEISTDRNAQLYTRSPSLTHQKFINAVSSALENQRRHSLNPPQQQPLQQFNNGNNNLFHSYNFEDYQHKENTSLHLSSPHNNNSFLPLPPPLKAITGRGFPSSPKDKTSLMGVGPNLMENIFLTKTIAQPNSFGVEARSVNQQRTSMVNGITTINQSCSNNIFLSSQHSLESSYNNIPTTISSNSSKTTSYYNRPNNFMTPRK